MILIPSEATCNDLRIKIANDEEISDDDIKGLIAYLREDRISAKKSTRAKGKSIKLTTEEQKSVLDGLGI